MENLLPNIFSYGMGAFVVLLFAGCIATIFNEKLGETLGMLAMFVMTMTWLLVGLFTGILFSVEAYQHGEGILWIIFSFFLGFSLLGLVPLSVACVTSGILGKIIKFF